MSPNIHDTRQSPCEHKGQSLTIKLWKWFKIAHKGPVDSDSARMTTVFGWILTALVAFAGFGGCAMWLGMPAAASWGIGLGGLVFVLAIGVVIFVVQYWRRPMPEPPPKKGGKKGAGGKGRKGS